MFGVNKNGNQKAWEAVITFAIVLAINMILLLPEGHIPNLTEFYIALRQALATALTLYAINRGIKWREEKKKEDESDEI